MSAFTKRTYSEAERSRIREVHDLAGRGEFQEAIRLAKSAVDAGLEHPLLFNILAIGEESAGAFDAAKALLDRALRISPDDIASLNALGLLCQRTEDYLLALSCFQRVVELDSSLAFAHVNRAMAYRNLGEYVKAESGFRDALRIEPTHPVALAGLAAVATARGDHEQGRLYGTSALGYVPGYPDAVLSVAAADIAQQRQALAAEHLHALLRNDQLDVLDRARAEAMLGDALDALGKIDEAYAAYLRANDLQRNFYAARFDGAETAYQYAVSLRDRLVADPISRWARRAKPTGAIGHVFLLGFPRTGTTMLEVILDGHPSVSSLDEQELLIDSVNAFMDRPEDLDLLLDAPESELERFRDAYWSRALKAGADLAGKIFVDKHPLNSLKLPLITRLFPDARIIFAVRDPRDVVLSCFRRQFKMSAPIYELLTLERAAAFYDIVMQVADRSIVLSDPAILEVRHEDLVADFHGQMGGVCRFLGLQWTEQMANFAARAKTRAQATPSTAQLARGLDKTTVQQWRRYQAHLKPVLSRLDPWVDRLRYPKT